MVFDLVMIVGVAFEFVFNQRRGSNKSVAAPVDKAGTNRTGPLSGAAATRFSSSAENCVFWHTIARRNAS
jgi:hypothetical protein